MIMTGPLQGAIDISDWRLVTNTNWHYTQFWCSYAVLSSYINHNKLTELNRPVLSLSIWLMLKVWFITACNSHTHIYMRRYGTTIQNTWFSIPSRSYLKHKGLCVIQSPTTACSKKLTTGRRIILLLHWYFTTCTPDDREQCQSSCLSWRHTTSKHERVHNTT
jgi:hypothetical protein